MLRIGLKIFSTDSFFTFYVAKLAYDRCLTRQALKLAEQAIRVDGYNDCHLLTLAASCAAILGDTDHAMTYAHRVTELVPEDVKALVLATQMALASGQLERAEKYVLKSLELKPQDPITLSQATQVALARGQYARAEEYVQRNLALEPQDPITLRKATQVALARGQFERADGYAQKLLNVEPENAIALGLATQVALARGQYERADGYAQKRLSVEPENAIALSLAMQLKIHKSEYGAAQLCYDALPKPLKEDKILGYLAAKAWFLDGKYGKALPILQTLIQRNPDPSISTLYLACLEAGNAALPMLRQALGAGEFDRQWGNSRDLRRKSGDAIALDEATMLSSADYGQTFWTSAATYGVNSAALIELGIKPRGSSPSFSGPPQSAPRLPGAPRGPGNKPDVGSPVRRVARPAAERGQAPRS